MSFNPAETDACCRLVALALREDLDGAGDVTTLATIPADLTGQGMFVARAPGVVAGLPAVEIVLKAVDERLAFQTALADGATVNPGRQLASVSGPMRSLLTAERTALNFLQRLSGVATMTRCYTDAVAGLPARVLDTRKTTPAWRLLEKYAVRCGGGHNHRLGLFDGFLIKDNHLAALGGGPAAIRQAIRLARQGNPSALPVEVEVDTLEQLDAALAERPDIVLLDNMGLDQLREAVRRRDAVAPEVKLEASGGVNLSTVRGIAETGIDCISVGALTHSASALDIALDYQ